MPELKVGFYSKKAHKDCGAAYYRSASGEKVLITAVYATQEEGEQKYLWSDTLCVGPVTEYLGRAKCIEGDVKPSTSGNVLLNTFTTNLKLGGTAFGVRGRLDFHVVSLTVGQIEITRTHPKYRTFPDEKCYTEKCMCIETGINSGTVWEYGVSIFATEAAAEQACIRHTQAAYKLRAERDAREAEQAKKLAEEELAELSRLKKKYGDA